MINRFKGENKWLSNFWMVTIEYNGKFYPSTEHAYQAARVLDPERHEQVRACETPASAMRMGRKFSDDPNWENKKLLVMEEVLRIKFQHPTLREWLLNTSGQDLVEGNTWGDVFWGVCEGKGENNLGRLLMKIRNELQSQTTVEA